MAQYLLKLRQEKLQHGHARALDFSSDLVDIRCRAHEAELCSRILGALKVLTNDSGRFIQEFLNDHQ